MTEIEACNRFTLETLYRLGRHLETPHLCSVKTTHAKSTLKINVISGNRNTGHHTDITTTSCF